LSKLRELENQNPRNFQDEDFQILDACLVGRLQGQGTIAKTIRSGGILNGGQSYYLHWTQPPFLTDKALQIYKQLDHPDEESNQQRLKWAIQATIKEYHTIWMAQPHIYPKVGFSGCSPDSLGIPPETEAAHFMHILQPFTAKHGISVLEFSEK
jgi:alpha,alpha-trehalase